MALTRVKARPLNLDMVTDDQLNWITDDIKNEVYNGIEGCPGLIDTSTIEILQLNLNEIRLNSLSKSTFYKARFVADLYIGVNPDPVKYVFSFERNYNTNTSQIEQHVKPVRFWMQEEIRLNKMKHNKEEINEDGE